MDPLFSLAPFILLILIPAITMRSFAEERQRGTIEFLFTKPLSDYDIIWGKFLANFCLVLFALLPTAIYYYSVYQLGSPVGNLDSGAIAGSYIGLFFLSASFVALGMLASALTDNQIVAFILGAFLCFVVHWAFDYLASLPVFIGTADAFIDVLCRTDSHLYYGLPCHHHFKKISHEKEDISSVVQFFYGCRNCHFGQFCFILL